MSVAILVPALNRPHRVKPLLSSIRDNTLESHRVVFICDRDDIEQRMAVHAAGLTPLIHDGSYAQKINHAIACTTEPLLFLAADDLDFKAGWLQAASAHLTDTVHVVGVNDLLERRPGRAGHATHFLMSRRYATRRTIDDQRGPLCEQYTHSFVDDELIATATRRGTYTYAPDAHVEHLHPMNGKSDDDTTYQLGREHFRRDRRLFNARSRLWT